MHICFQYRGLVERGRGRQSSDYCLSQTQFRQNHPRAVVLNLGCTLQLPGSFKNIDACVPPEQIESQPLACALVFIVSSPGNSSLSSTSDVRTAAPNIHCLKGELVLTGNGKLPGIPYLFRNNGGVRV